MFSQALISAMFKHTVNHIAVQRQAYRGLCKAASAGWAGTEPFPAHLVPTESRRLRALKAWKLFSSPACAAVASVSHRQSRVFPQRPLPAAERRSEREDRAAAFGHAERTLPQRAPPDGALLTPTLGRGGGKAGLISSGKPQRELAMSPSAGKHPCSRAPRTVCGSSSASLCRIAEQLQRGRKHLSKGAEARPAAAAAPATFAFVFPSPAMSCWWKGKCKARRCRALSPQQRGSHQR